MSLWSILWALEQDPQPPELSPQVHMLSACCSTHAGSANYELVRCDNL